MLKLLELRRRHERAEAELVKLRDIVRRLHSELDAVPEKDVKTLELLAEARREFA